MRCPYCKGLEDRVIDSRIAEDAAAIRRRRECGSCGKRYTTFERAESVPLQVRKRSGELVAFDRSKVIAGLRKACVNRPVADEELTRVADEIEETVRAKAAGEVGTQDVGLSVLEHLRALDDIAYLRFASVYKDFQEVTDFERELGHLLEKTTPPKAPVAVEGGTQRGA